MTDQSVKNFAMGNSLAEKDLSSTVDQGRRFHLVPRRPG